MNSPDYPERCGGCLHDTFDLVDVDGSYAWECRDCGTLHVGVDEDLVSELPALGEYAHD